MEQSERLASCRDAPTPKTNAIRHQRADNTSGLLSMRGSPTPISHLRLIAGRPCRNAGFSSSPSLNETIQSRNFFYTVSHLYYCWLFWYHRYGEVYFQHILQWTSNRLRLLSLTQARQLVTAWRNIRPHSTIRLREYSLLWMDKMKN